MHAAPGLSIDETAEGLRLSVAREAEGYQAKRGARHADSANQSPASITRYERSVIWRGGANCRRTRAPNFARVRRIVESDRLSRTQNFTLRQRDIRQETTLIMLYKHVIIMSGIGLEPRP